MPISDYILDNGLNALDTVCDMIFLCSAEPTTYIEATVGDPTGYALASKNWGAGNAYGSPAAATPNGEKVTAVDITSGFTASAGGTANYWAAVDSSGDGTLHATGPLANPTLVSIGTNCTLAPYAIQLPANSDADDLVVGSRVLEAGLNALHDECDEITICSQKPTTYTQAHTTYMLGHKTFTRGTVFGAPSAGTGGGRVSTSVELSAGNANQGDIESNGDANWWAACDTTGGGVLLCTGLIEGGA